jgi:L-fuculose-phosphate aldolase
MAYSDMSVDDLVFLSLDGNQPERPTSKPARLPSSEWYFHAAIYRDRPEVNAVLHAHPRFSTALACTERAIPPFTYMVAMGGGKDIRCAPYAIFGSDVLADNTVQALEGRQACLLAHHGSIALGDSPEDALQLCREVEELAAQYCEILKIGGEKHLSDEQMEAVLEKFKTYGQQKEQRKDPQEI